MASNGAFPLFSLQFQMLIDVLEEHVKNPGRVAAGLRASIKNPRVSDEAKAHATERLQELESQQHAGTDQSGSHGNRVLGGYKATLHNQHTSEEAKKHAREILNAAGIHEPDIDLDDQQHKNRVLAGYKAALHNPKVSEEAKQHARQYLEEHDTT
ncbi:Conidiation-specific protein 6 [Termitomyces sp. J132]|nr:Conidiation-specific protein 6 [Termitomyces sp. J132]